MRYRLLNEWAIDRQLPAIATAHHADDQAETLLMRLLRGAGVGGLGATRSKRPLSEHVMLVRPVLGWRKTELIGLVTDAGLNPVDDPSNRDPRHDRSRIRNLLRHAEWADPARLAVSASALRDADEALDWALAPLIGSRINHEGGSLVIEPFDLPRELKRRLLLAAFAELAAPAPRGPDAMRALDALEMIPLQNLNEQHIGFLLPAGLPTDFASTVGEWVGDCIFMALPTKPELFDDPAFRVLGEHKDAGEHRIAVRNDGATISVVATAPTGAQLFVRLPASAPGAWGTRGANTDTQMGYAVRVTKPNG